MLRYGKHAPTRSSITILGRMMSLVMVSTGGGGGGRGVIDGDVLPVLLLLLLLHRCWKALTDSFVGQSRMQSLGR